MKEPVSNKKSLPSPAESNERTNNMTSNVPLPIGNVLQMQRLVGNKAISQLMGINKVSNHQGGSQQIVQRKALSKDKLNVAGEIHPESDAQRELERAFSAEKTGSPNYWQEPEFKTLDGARADPTFHRLHQYMDYLYSLNLNTLIQRHDELNGDIPEAKQNYINNWVTVTPYITENLNAFFKELKKYENGTLIVSDESEQKILNKIIKNYRQSLSGFWSNLTETFEIPELAVAEPKPKETTKGLEISDFLFVHELKLFWTYVTEVFKLFEEKSGNKNAEEISLARSMAMNHAAESKKDEKGVWKIGNDHVKDIIIKTDEQNYNLITRPDFIKEFQEWENQKTSKKK